MRVLAISVGKPRTLVYGDREIETGIFKSPVAGRHVVRRHNIEGDGQADLVNHGGLEKAVYAYPFEHYPFWREFFGTDELPFGALGENLTTEGMSEGEIHLGDRLGIGTVELVATQPRVPCYKLAAKFGREDAVPAMLRSGRSGIHFAVAQEGIFEAGDEIRVLARDPEGVAIADLTRVMNGEPVASDLIPRALRVEALAPWWRRYLAGKLIHGGG